MNLYKYHKNSSSLKHHDAMMSNYPHFVINAIYDFVSSNDGPIPDKLIQLLLKSDKFFTPYYRKHLTRIAQHMAHAGQQVPDKMLKEVAKSARAAVQIATTNNQRNKYFEDTFSDIDHINTDRFEMMQRYKELFHLK